MKKSIAGAALFVIAAALMMKLGGAQPRFDHELHARLFPVCGSCHEGIESGDVAAMYPSAQDCAQCHNGKDEEKIEWSGPQRVASNLKFVHADHFESAGEKDCEACHASKPGAQYMSVARARPETCLACHTDGQQGAGPVVHYAQTNDCAQCHVPLRAATGLGTAQIARFGQPRAHAAQDFLMLHSRTTVQDAANCATCHTTESCSRCHANAANVKVIASLGSNANVTGVVAGKKAVYPKPFDHTQRGFREQHGMLAEAGLESCSNCHTREGCQQCHRGNSAADAMAQLPLRNQAPGVSITRRGSAHPAGFAEAHGNTAGASGESCTSCHSEKFCSDCHQGADSRKFHPANFATRHAQAVYAADTDCASCHNRESFCQSCHNGLGLSANGQRTTQFHNGQSIWLLQHGQPARQNLESCTSCHTQSSCARCHSSKGGWGVNPHGSGNTSQKLGDKNQPQCLRCHFSGAMRN